MRRQLQQQTDEEAPIDGARILLSTNVIGVRAEQGFKPSGEIPNPGCLGPPTAVKFSTN